MAIKKTVQSTAIFNDKKLGQFQKSTGSGAVPLKENDWMQPHQEAARQAFDRLNKFDKVNKKED